MNSVTGYKPFLGQVRMAGQRLGQVDMAAAYEAQIQTLLNTAMDLPGASQLIQQGNACSAQAARLRRASTPEDRASATSSVEMCVKELETMVGRAVRAQAAEAPATAGAAAPNGAYVVVALVAVGLITYAVTR